MYTPDNTFMKRLKTLDKKLGCSFAQTHGHFVVTYKRAHGGAVPIMVVKNEKNNGFRQPDERDLKKLMAGDMQNSTAKQQIQKTAAYMENVREKSKKDAADNFRNMTKDDKIQLSNTLVKASGSGKGNSTFRRITPKTIGRKI